jgi:hypothetical protein
LAVDDGETDGGVDVEGEGDDQADPHDPESHVRGEDRVEELAEGVPVLIDLEYAGGIGGDEDLEIADHMGDDEPDEEKAGDGHHPLLADR